MTPRPDTTARRARRAIAEAGGLALRQDLAILFDLSYARAHELARHSTFPEPVGHTMSDRPVWAVNEVLDWNRRRRRQPGPAPGATP